MSQLTTAIDAPPSPREILRLQPRFFFALAGIATALFLFWSYLTLTTDVIPALDLRWARFWHDWTGEHHRLWSYMVVITDLGGVAAMALLVVMGVIWQASVQNRRLAIAWLFIVIGGGLLNVAIKELCDRPRPPTELRDRAVLETNLSYPSGHSMGSAIGYGMLAYALALTYPCWRRRTAAIVSLSLVVFLVGFSRSYLRAHWLSDVIGGWTVGLAWLCLCVGVLELSRARNRQASVVRA